MNKIKKKEYKQTITSIVKFALFINFLFLLFLISIFAFYLPFSSACVPLNQLSFSLLMNKQISFLTKWKKIGK